MSDKKTIHDLPCKWEQDSYYDSQWHTECAGIFELFHDTPAENGMVFCPYCGGQIDEVQANL